MSILPSACGMWAHYSPYPMINKSKPEKPTAHRWFMLHFHDIGRSRSDGQDNGKGADWVWGDFYLHFPSFFPQSDDDANFFFLLLVFLWRKKIMQGRRRRRSHDRPLNSWRSSQTQSRRRTDGGSEQLVRCRFLHLLKSFTHRRLEEFAHHGNQMQLVGWSTAFANLPFLFVWTP